MSNISNTIPQTRINTDKTGVTHLLLYVYTYSNTLKSLKSAWLTAKLVLLIFSFSVH